MTDLRVLSSDCWDGYHRTIYDRMPPCVRDGTLREDELTDLDGLAHRLASWDVFHMHWPEWFLAASVPDHRRFLAALRRARVPVVWTQHNLVPHDRRTDMRPLYQLWAGAASCVIHHSYWGMARATSVYRYRTGARHKVIHHPHYGPLVRIQETREAIEAAFGLRHNVLRLAVVGAPRPGKQATLAMQAVAAAGRRDLELRVFALTGDEPVPDDPRVIATRYRTVDRAEYDSWLRACDALVMPFDPAAGLLTTGTAADAVAHGLPCLTSEWGYLTETLRDAAVVYGSTAADLASVLDGLTGTVLDKARTACRELREMYDPDRIATQTLTALREILSEVRLREHE